MKQIILTIAIVAASVFANAAAVYPVQEKNVFTVEASDRTQIVVRLVMENYEADCNAVGISNVDVNQITAVDPIVPGDLPTEPGIKLVGYDMNPMLTSTLAFCPGIIRTITLVSQDIVVDVMPNKSFTVQTPKSVTRIEVDPVAAPSTEY